MERVATTAEVGIRHRCDGRLADEVGLGKTLVAAGVIAQAIDHLTALNTPRIDVDLHLLNQAIAPQNVERIRHRLSIVAADSPRYSIAFRQVPVCASHPCAFDPS